MPQVTEKNLKVQHLTEGITKIHIFRDYLSQLQGRFLDVGCGTGEVMKYVCSSLEVVGIDVSNDYLRKAVNRGEKAIWADLTRPLPFETESFDAALCSDVLEHLINPFATLCEIHRILKTDGLLFAHVPNEFGHKSLMQIFRGNGICNHSFFPDAEEWNYPHIRFFSHKGFKSMLQKGGFAIKDDLTNFGRGWRRFFYPLFGSGPSFVAKKIK